MTDFIIWAVPIWIILSIVGALMVGKGISLRMREMDD